MNSKGVAIATATIGRPLQNRVTPCGEIVAVPERGRLMGNRGGQMHRADKTLTGRRWVSRAWIACVLAYKDRHEVIMADRHYTQLFFMDEATALAAGHRPCALCRRADFNRFSLLFAEAQGHPVRLKVAAMDHILHAERVSADRGKRLHVMQLADCPDGVMILANSTPQLWWARRLHAWSCSGYAPAEKPSVGIVDVLTPPAIVAVLRLGYRPLLHPSLQTV